MERKRTQHDGNDSDIWDLKIEILVGILNGYEIFHGHEIFNAFLMGMVLFLMAGILWYFS